MRGAQSRRAPRHASYSGAATTVSHRPTTLPGSCDPSLFVASTKSSPVHRRQARSATPTACKRHQKQKLSVLAEAKNTQHWAGVPFPRLANSESRSTKTPIPPQQCRLAHDPPRGVALLACLLPVPRSCQAYCTHVRPIKQRPVARCANVRPAQGRPRRPGRSPVSWLGGRAQIERTSSLFCNSSAPSGPPGAPCLR